MVTLTDKMLQEVKDEARAAGQAFILAQWVKHELALREAHNTLAKEIFSLAKQELEKSE